MLQIWGVHIKFWNNISWGISVICKKKQNKKPPQQTTKTKPKLKKKHTWKQRLVMMGLDFVC